MCALLVPGGALARLARVVHDTSVSGTRCLKHALGFRVFPQPLLQDRDAHIWQSGENPVLSSLRPEYPQRI